MGKRGPARKVTPPTTIRLDDELKAQIEEAAKRSQRKPSEEIRARLRASFSSVEFAVPETKGLAYVIALALELEQSKTGLRWFQHPWAFRRAWFAINQALLYFRPPGDPFTVPDDAKPLRRMRSSGLERLIPEAAKELKNSRSAKISGQMAVAIFEKVAGGRRSIAIDDELEPIAHVVKDLLVELGNDTAALREAAAPIVANLQGNAGAAAVAPEVRTVFGQESPDAGRGPAGRAGLRRAQAGGPR